MDQKIDNLDARLTSRIDGVDTRIEGVDQQLRVAIDIRERLAALEARRPS